jgi:hypothetical protein
MALRDYFQRFVIISRISNGHLNGYRREIYGNLPCFKKSVALIVLRVAAQSQRPMLRHGRLPICILQPRFTEALYNIGPSSSSSNRGRHLCARVFTLLVSLSVVRCITASRLNGLCDEADQIAGTDDSRKLQIVHWSNNWVLCIQLSQHLSINTFMTDHDGYELHRFLPELINKHPCSGQDLLFGKYSGKSPPGYLFVR